MGPAVNPYQFRPQSEPFDQTDVVLTPFRQGKPDTLTKSLVLN